MRTIRTISAPGKGRKRAANPTGRPMCMDCKRQRANLYSVRCNDCAKARTDKLQVRAIRRRLGLRQYGDDLMDKDGNTKLKPLSDEHSKQDEIDALESIVTHYADSQTFLESLFSGGLLEWFSGQATDDHSTDIYGMYLSAERAAKAAQADAAEWRRQLEKNDADLDKAKVAYADAEAQAERVYAEYQRQIADLEVVAETLRQGYTESTMERNTARAERDSLAAELQRTKAEAYDLLRAHIAA